MTQIRNKIIGQNACIREQDLRDLEREYNFKFPEDIKQFYLKYNGGRLEKHSYAAQNDMFIFQSFYSIKTGHSTLNEKLRLNYVDDWWPKELIPFGYDDDGNVPIEYVAPDFLTFINNMVE